MLISRLKGAGVGIDYVDPWVLRWGAFTSHARSCCALTRSASSPPSAWQFYTDICRGSSCRSGRWGQCGHNGGRGTVDGGKGPHLAVCAALGLQAAGAHSGTFSQPGPAEAPPPDGALPSRRVLIPWGKFCFIKNIREA